MENKKSEICKQNEIAESDLKFWLNMDKEKIFVLGNEMSVPGRQHEIAKSELKFWVNMDKKMWRFLLENLY